MEQSAVMARRLRKFHFRGGLSMESRRVAAAIAKIVLLPSARFGAKSRAADAAVTTSSRQ